MSSDPLTLSSHPAGGPDPRLQRLLELWDRLDEEQGLTNTLGVTVLVQGVTYSGLLIAGRVWARTMGDLLRNADQESSQMSALGVFYDEIALSYEQAGAPDESRDYLHLANAVIGLPNGGTATQLMLRIRASDVSAWSVGTMGAVAQFAPSASPGPAARA